MTLKITQTAGLLVELDCLKLFDSGCDELTDDTTYDECNSSVVKIPDGTLETELPITGMELSKLMYLKSDQAIKIKAVPPSGNVANTTEYTLTPNLVSFLGFDIESIYVKNDTGFDATIVQGYIGVNQ